MSDNLTELQRELLRRIMTNLDNMKVAYAIRLPDGNVLGDLDAVKGKAPKAPVKYQRRRSIHPVGELTNHVKPYVENLQPGEAIVIPVDKFDPHSVQSSAGQYLAKKYGRGQWITALNADKTSVEVLVTGGM